MSSSLAAEDDRRREIRKICLEIELNLLRIKIAEHDACCWRIKDYSLREKLYTALNPYNNDEEARKENVQKCTTPSSSLLPSYNYTPPVIFR
jgi:hypothetical protein